jgi:hypothetical protein
MVAATILQQERAEALEGLASVLAGLDGADAERVEEIHERSRAGQVRLDQEYLTAMFLAEIARVCDDQGRRIAALESRSAAGA